MERIFQRRLQNNVEEQDLGARPYYRRCVWWRKQEAGTLSAERAASRTDRHKTVPLRCSRQPM